MAIFIFILELFNNLMRARPDACSLFSNAYLWRTKAEFRFIFVDFVPFLNIFIGLGHVAVKIKKLHDFVLVLSIV